MSVVGVELRPTAPCQSRTRDGYRLFITRPLCEHILDYSTLWLAAASRMLVIGTSSTAQRAAFQSASRREGQSCRWGLMPQHLLVAVFQKDALHGPVRQQAHRESVGVCITRIAMLSAFHGSPRASSADGSHLLIIDATDRTARRGRCVRSGASTQ